MRHPRLLAATLALLLAGGTGEAGQYVVAGKKLLLKTPPSGAAGNRIVHIGTGAAIAVGQEGGAGDPRCVGAGSGGTSSLRITTTGGAVTIPLPCHRWSLNGAKNAYRYTDSSGETCRLVQVKNGALVKAVCKGDQVAVAVGAGMAPVSVIVRLNTDAFCAEYGGTAVHDGSDGATLLRKSAAEPASCPTTTSTTVTTATRSTTLGCCILYAGQCSWTTSEYECILNQQGAALGEPGSVCDGASGSCLPTATPGYCCAYPGNVCTSGPTGVPEDCTTAGGAVHLNATCTADGACNPVP
jgi:hypothetical protein